jgi:hypothetical protein
MWDVRPSSRRRCRSSGVKRQDNGIVRGRQAWQTDGHLLQSWTKVIRRKRPVLLTAEVILLHENATPRTATATYIHIAAFGWERLDRGPLSCSSPPPFLLLVQRRGRRPLPSFFLVFQDVFPPRWSGGIQATYYTMKREYSLTQYNNKFTRMKKEINTNQSTNRTGTTETL